MRYAHRFEVTDLRHLTRGERVIETVDRLDDLTPADIRHIAFSLWAGRDPDPLAIAVKHLWVEDGEIKSETIFFNTTD